MQVDPAVEKSSLCTSSFEIFSLTPKLGSYSFVSFISGDSLCGLPTLCSVRFISYQVEVCFFICLGGL